MDNPPLVTVILPIRNEGRYIGKCLDAVLAQDYPLEKIEILVVDGLSDDDTREIVGKRARYYAQVRMLDNPKRFVPSALNLGIQAARGQVIVRVDGHAIIARDYVRQCVQTLRDTGADCVGGHMRPKGDTSFAKAVALAYGSPFGLGGGRFHLANSSGYADTVYMGAYKRAVLDRVGLFNETLVRNQDIEFNYRLRKNGGKIYLSSLIQSKYYPRASLTELARQNYRTGYWNIKTISESPGSLSLRHFIPLLFVLGLAANLILAIAIPPFSFLFGSILAVYSIGLLVSSLVCVKRNGWQYFPILLAIFPCLHFSYGIGSIAGLFGGLIKVTHI
ncbi:partial Poly-beta-1,6-N-acetyl-D-glucosamine synthase, partial [Anaerolineae bacterium]